MSMRKSILLALALLSSAAGASLASTEGTRMFVANRIHDATSVALALLELLPESGAGADTANEDFCSTHSSAFSGSYFCLSGDGTSIASAGMELSASGDAVSGQLRTFCPDGTDCNDYDTIDFASGTGAYKTGNVASPAGDFSFGVVVFVPESAGSAKHFLAKMNNAGTNQVAALHTTSDRLFTINSAAHTATESGPTFGRWEFLVGTYDFVGNGTSVMKYYSDGVELTAQRVTNAAGPITAASTPWSIGAKCTAAGSCSAGVTEGYYIRNAFVTDGVLSDATIAAMNATAHAQLTGSASEALTHTRASSVYCANASDNGNFVANSQECWGASGLLVEKAATNLLVRTEEMDHAAWTAGGTISRTADQAVSPNGTTTADAVVVNVSDAGAYLFQRIACTAGTTYTFSAWVWTDSGTKSFRLSRTDATTWATATVSPTFTATTTPQRFSLTYTPSGGETQCDNVFGHDGKTPFNPTAGTYYVWGAQTEVGTYPSSYIRSVGTSTTRAVVTATMATPVTSNSYCVSAVLTPINWTATNPILSFNTGAYGSANGLGLYTNSSGQVVFEVYDNAGDAKTFTTTAGLSGASKRIKGCSASGTLSVSVDGASAAGSTTGTGTGLLTTFEPIVLGNLGSTASHSRTVRLKEVCVDANNGACP